MGNKMMFHFVLRHSTHFLSPLRYSSLKTKNETF